MADLHDERFVEMVEELDDGHIEVKLDFIPVEERLPEEEVLVFGMIDGRFGRLKLRWDGLWCNEDGAWPTVTHWAEIPEIKEA